MRTALTVTGAVILGLAGAAGIVYLLMSVLMVPVRVLAVIVEAM